MKQHSKYSYSKRVCKCSMVKGNIFVCGDFEEDDSQGSVSLQVFDSVTSEWKFCTKFPQTGEKFKISCLRIPRGVLDKCKVLS